MYANQDGFRILYTKCLSDMLTKQSEMEKMNFGKGK